MPFDNDLESYFTKIQDKQKKIVEAIQQQSENFDKCEKFNQRIAQNHYVLQNDEEAEEGRTLFNEFKDSLYAAEKLIKELEDIIRRRGI